MDQESMSKLSVTQNVIRDKFKKAYANRLEHEHDADQTMKPFLMESSNEATSLSTSSTSTLLKKDSKEVGRNEESQYNSNELCKRLRLLLTSRIVGSVDHTPEINTIIAELRELKILV